MTIQDHWGLGKRGCVWGGALLGGLDGMETNHNEHITYTWLTKPTLGALVFQCIVLVLSLW